MHGQVTDFMDVLFGETPDVSGEINFVIPRQTEFDQELEFDDINDLIQNGDDISLIPDMDILLGKSGLCFFFFFSHEVKNSGEYEKQKKLKGPELCIRVATIWLYDRVDVVSSLFLFNGHAVGSSVYTFLSDFMRCTSDTS